MLSNEGKVGFDETITEEMAKDIYYKSLTNNNVNKTSKPNRRRQIDSNTGKIDEADKQTLLDYHNNYRIALSSGDGTVVDSTGSMYATASNMNELFWDPALAAVADAYAEELASSCGSLSHNSGRHDDFYSYEDLATFGYPTNIYLGENVAVTWSTSATARMSRYTDRLDDMWEEYSLWQYQAYSSGSINGAGHFTQLAWSDTRYVGCGVGTKCYDGSYYKYFLVCNYWVCKRVVLPDWNLWLILNLWFWFCFCFVLILL